MQGSTTDKEIDILKQENTNLKQEMEKLKQEMEKLKQELTNLRRDNLILQQLGYQVVVVLLPVS